MADFVGQIFQWTVNMISDLGYWGIYFAMMIESASIPLPSEIIMGFAGYLVNLGEMNVWIAGIVGALGNISGSTIMYVLGLKGGRPIIDKYGKNLHVTPERMEKVDGWFAKWGDELVFVSQLMPGVRTFVSLPAGILKVNFPKFIVYTFVGAWIWCTGLAYVAWKISESLQSNWDAVLLVLEEKMVFLKYGVVGIVAIVAIYLGWKWYNNKKKSAK